MNVVSTTFGYQCCDNLEHCNLIVEKSKVWQEWRFGTLLCYLPAIFKTG